MPIDLREKTLSDIILKGETLCIFLKTADFFKKDVECIIIKRNDLIGIRSYGEDTLELYFKVFPPIYLKMNSTSKTTDSIIQLLGKELTGNVQGNTDLLGLNS